MEISKEDRDFLIKQIENDVGTRPIFYLKFCSCLQFARDALNGDFYGNTALFFRKKEIESGERGQGDQFELINIIKLHNLTMFDGQTNNVVLTTPEATAKIQFKDDDIIPIISFVGVPLRDMVLIDIGEDYAEFKFPFTDDEYGVMEERFGKYCVVIGGKELDTSIARYCSKVGAEYIFDRIEYCNQNRTDRIQAFQRCTKERFLYKNNDLSYQREFRLAIGIEMPKDHFIRIGKLQHAKMLDSEKLKDMGIRIGFTTSNI